MIKKFTTGHWSSTRRLCSTNLESFFHKFLSIIHQNTVCVCVFDAMEGGTEASLSARVLVSCWMRLTIDHVTEAEPDEIHSLFLPITSAQSLC